MKRLIDNIKREWNRDAIAHSYAAIVLMAIVAVVGFSLMVWLAI